MIKIPQKYVERIVRAFGQEGANWLNSIDTLIKKYKDKFAIEDIRYLTYSTNLLFERIFKKIKTTNNIKML